jgi:hypothetical protein
MDRKLAINGHAAPVPNVIVKVDSLALESVAAQGRVGGNVTMIRGSAFAAMQDFPLHKPCDIVTELGGVTFKIEDAVITGMKLAKTDKGEPLAEIYWGGGTYTAQRPQPLVGT